MFCRTPVEEHCSIHRALGKKATVPIYKVLVRPDRESNSRPTSTAADALTTRPQADVRTKVKKQLFLPCSFIFK